MSLINKKSDFTPFDMSGKPVKQFAPLALLLWAAVPFLTKGLRIIRYDKDALKGLKPPYLVISTHQGFSDYYILPRILFPHRACYVSDMEGFAAFGMWLYKNGGCIGKRRYVPDVNVVRNIRYALHTLKQPVVVFPESRHCDAGITSHLPDNLGRLAKITGVPVVTVTNHGSYLKNPFWDEAHTRKTPMESEIRLLFTENDVHILPEEELNRAIKESLSYNEYDWQKRNNIKITYKKRAEGLHLPLYKCKECGAEGNMESSGSTLRCCSCGKMWELSETGELISDSGDILSIPDWYTWERDCVKEMLRSREYQGIDVKVRIDALPNEKGFIALGEGRLKHDTEGYVLSLDKPLTGLKDTFPLKIKNASLESVQTEYNYRERGKAIVLSTRDCCYYIYSDDPEFIVTKLEFITEEIL